MKRREGNDEAFRGQEETTRDAVPPAEEAATRGSRRRFTRWRPHDFQRTRLLSEAQARTLETLHRKFVRQAAEALSVLVRSRVELALIGVGQRSFSEFIHSLPNPTSLHLVYCQPRGLSFVLEVGPGAVFAMIERLLGGKGDDAFQPVRPFTRIEQVLADMVAERLLAALRETWSVPGEEFRFELAEPEHNPLLMQVVGPSEPSIVLSFQIAVGLSSARAHLCLPSRSFTDVVEVLAHPAARGPRAQGNSAAERERILNGLGAVEVELTAELEPIPLAIGDLLGLKPGDVVDTQIPRLADVAVRLEGGEVLRGAPVTHEGRLAVKVARAEAEG